MNNLSAASKGLQRAFTPFFILLFSLILLPTSLVFAQGNKNYGSVQNGYWGDATTWQPNNPAPINITNNVVVEIAHIVTTGNLKITNGGTILIKNNGELKGEYLDLKGEAQVIIAPGGFIGFDNFAFDNTNGTENITVTKDDLILAPLPVTLVYFEVKRTALSTNITTLEWLTASEKNNGHFVVEKSLDGKLFTEAGRVAGKNASNGAKYTFEDKEVAGRVYYRLKQVDLDGTFTYSAIIVASGNQKFAVNGKNVIFSQAFTGNLFVYDMAGNKVKSTVLNNAASYELPNTLNGIFLLQLESGNQVSTQRIGL